MKTKSLIAKYIQSWRSRGYPNDIPDEVPGVLEKLALAPSYKAIALALLKNDMNMTLLGFSAPKSPWYSAIKRVEIEERNRASKENAECGE